MRIAPSPTRQSCATWQYAMMRQPAPISVQPSGRVARWIVTYSRSTVSGPIRTPEGVPSLNLRSWGRPPSTAPWPTSASAPIVTPAPTTEKAPIRAAGWIRAAGSTSAVGWIGSARVIALRPLGAGETELALEALEPPLRLAKAPHDLRELLLEGEEALGAQHGPRRRAEDLLARRDVARESRLREHDGAVADRQVIGDADLSGQDHAAPDPARARDADLGDDDRVLADLDVVRDLDEVVDLRAPPADGVAERRAVDRRVGTDLDVVLDEDAAHLRDLPVRLPGERVAEPVGADHRAGVDDHAAPEPDARAEHHARVEHGVLPDLGARADEREGVDAHARAQHRTRLDHGERAHRRGRVDARVRRD